MFSISFFISFNDYLAAMSCDDSVGIELPYASHPPLVEPHEPNANVTTKPIIANVKIFFILLSFNLFPLTT
jgi:hypothetical protein